MGNIRPFQLILMAIFVVIAIAGLVLFSTFQGFRTGEVQVGTVTIWGTLPQAQMQRALNAYKEQYQGFTGVTYRERAAASFDADLAEAIATGQGPDLLIVSQEDLYAMRNKLSTLPASVISDRLVRDNYLQAYEQFLVPEGGGYGIPFVLDPLVLFYNRPLWSSLGVAQPPATWEAISGLAATRATQGAATTPALIALGTYENVTHARDILSLLFLQAGSRITERSTNGMRATLTDSTSSSFGATGVERALNFYTEFANPTKTVYSWSRAEREDRAAFIAGDLILYLGLASEQQLLTDTNPNLDFDMAPAPTPANASARVGYGRAYAFAVPRVSKNQQGALSVAQILSAPTAAPVFARTLGMAPAYRSALATRPEDVFEPVFYQEALVARGWIMPSAAIADRAFAGMITNVASGRDTVTTAISTAAQTITAAFR